MVHKAYVHVDMVTYSFRGIRKGRGTLKSLFTFTSLLFSRTNTIGFRIFGNLFIHAFKCKMSLKEQKMSAAGIALDLTKYVYLQDVEFLKDVELL